MNRAMMQSNKQNWGTPPGLFAAVSLVYGPFDLDVCALPQTAKCPAYYSLENGDDGLSAPWRGACWCNPPYNQLRRWIEKGVAELRAGNCRRVVYLITARPDTIAWQDYIFPYASHVHFLRGRLKFIESESMRPAEHGAMFPSAVVVFDGPLMHRGNPLQWDAVAENKEHERCPN